MWTTRYYDTISVNETSNCENAYSGVPCGNFVNSYIHEILHNHDIDTVVSPYCDSAAPCTALNAFVEAAEADGVTFDSRNHVQIAGTTVSSSTSCTFPGYTDRNICFYLNKEFPDNEMFAYLGSRFATDAELIRQNYPHVYEYYRDSVYAGIEYETTTDKGASVGTIQQIH